MVWAKPEPSASRARPKSVTAARGTPPPCSTRMTFAPFDEANLPRIVQLINKTNQFNLTTRRYTDADVRAPYETDWTGRFSGAA